MKNILQKIALLGMLLAIAGCAAEQNYRGVPRSKWIELTEEQKQLIVDKAYQDEIK